MPSEMIETTERVEDHLRLAAKITSLFLKKNGQSAANFEDTFEYSDALEGLLKAVEKYDLSYKVRFSTFAFPVIANCIINGRRRRLAASNKGKLEFDSSKIEHFFVKLSKNPEIDVDELLSEDNYSERERPRIKVLKAHFIDGQEWKVIRKKMGVSNAYVMRLRKQGLEILRNRLKDAI